MRAGSRGGSWEHKRCHEHIIYKTQKELTAERSSGDLGRSDAQTITMELMTQAGEARRRLLHLATQGKKQAGERLLYSSVSELRCGKDPHLSPGAPAVGPGPPAACWCWEKGAGLRAELLCISTSMVKACQQLASAALFAACSACSSLPRASNLLSCF